MFAFRISSIPFLVVVSYLDLSSFLLVVPIADITMMMSRSGSVRPPRHHAAWNRFVESLSVEMSEEEILSLQLATVLKLAAQYGYESPLDIAHIELAWGERQGLELQSTNNNFHQEQSQPQQSFESPPPKPVENGTHAKPTSATRRPIARPGSAGASTSPKPAVKTSAPRAASPSSAQKSVNFQPNRGSGDPDGKIKVKNVASKIDTGKVRRPEQFDEDEVICVEDAKDVFTRYAAFANGNMKELDASRFAKMVKECDLIDKLFTLREADVLFTKARRNGADRRIPYHVFRMQLLPEMAAKKHCSIAAIVKAMNHHGGPELRRRAPSASQSQEREEEVYEEEVAPPPPPPPAASASKRPAGTTPKVPPLRKK